MKATVLVDNIGESPLAGEWGLSIYIEYGNKRCQITFHKIRLHFVRHFFYFIICS